MLLDFLENNCSLGTNSLFLPGCKEPFAARLPTLVASMTCVRVTIIVVDCIIATKPTFSVLLKANRLQYCLPELVKQHSNSNTDHSPPLPYFSLLIPYSVFLHVIRIHIFVLVPPLLGNDSGVCEHDYFHVCIRMFLVELSDCQMVALSIACA